MIKNICYLGGQRRFKVIPALQKHFTVYTSFKRQPDTAVMVDQVNFKCVGYAILAKILRMPLYVRLRGGLWERLTDKQEDSRLRLVYRAINKITLLVLLNMADKLICVSNFVTQQANDFTLTPRAVTVYNPVDIEYYRNYPRGEYRRISENTFLVLTVTNTRYRDKYQPLWERIDSLIPPNGELVVVSGGVADMRPLYADCDLYVHISNRDTFCNPIVEAKAAGKPVKVFGCPVLYEVNALPVERFSFERIGEDFRRVINDKT